MEHLAINNAGRMPMALSTANETYEQPAAVGNDIAADRSMQVATLFRESSTLLGEGENGSTSTTPNIDATTSPTSTNVMESTASPPTASPASSPTLSPSHTTAEVKADHNSSPKAETIGTTDEIIKPVSTPEPTTVEAILSTEELPPTIATEQTIPDVSPSDNQPDGGDVQACSSPVSQTPTPLSSPHRTTETIEQSSEPTVTSPSELPDAATSPAPPPSSNYKNDNNEANNNNIDDEAGATVDDSERCLDELMDSAVSDQRAPASLHSDPHHDPHHHHHHHHHDHNAQHHHSAMFRDMADDVTATMQPSYDQLNIQHIDQQQRDYLPDQHQMHHHHHHQMHNHQMQSEQIQHHQQQQHHPQQQQQHQQQHHHMQQQLHLQQQHHQQQQQHHAVHQERLLEHPHHHHHHHQMDQQQLQSHHQQQQQMDHQQQHQMDQQQYKL